ncbi:hypothetical protein LPB19_03740 [Marinobacter salinisoli]|uniref:Cytochrome c-552/4 domain-containing protein n=1 Tax=Marinobacter salinisoli TaxID=2769486 RepID=A0ABX7MTP3_9GAMM|nr:multiheme c-type cytochrome [Marinobacter salinisoli]QSP95539.1 hypothetical protein LPB19_03740 [Marinobacter salinisoli]
MSVSSKNWPELERKSSPGFYAQFTFVAVTGLLTPWLSDASFWIQAIQFSHSILGLVFGVLSLSYLWAHFRKSFGQRRPLVIISGIVVFAGFLGLVFSGSFVAVLGQSERFSWVYSSHEWLAYAVVGMLVVHIALHRVTINSARKKREREIYPSLHKGIARPLISVFVAGIVGISAIVLTNAVTHEPYRTKPVAEPYQYTYGEHPFRPAQTETYHDGFIDERQIGGSQNCAGCHEQIAKQWFASAHRKAASDPAYMTNVSLLAEKKDITATRYCEGCHAPVALLTGELSAGGKHGGIAGSSGNLEGVGCMGCHGISKVVHLKGNGSYEYTPARDYLFQASDNALGEAINRYITKISPQLHRNDLSRDVLSSAEMCATCHAQFMDKEMNDWGWVKMQDEYAAWLDSPFSGQHNTAFSEGNQKQCQDCHMPLEKMDDPSANEDGMVRSHDFPAANTMLAVVDGDQKHLEKTISFLQKNKMQIDIDPPTRTDATQNRMALSEGIRARTETPAYFYLGEEARINVVVSNVGVGHNFPGGTIDINEAWIDFSVLDAEGREVFRSGGLNNENQDVDPQAKFYRSLPVDRKGKHVWKHDLFNMVGHAEKSVIPAGGSDIETYRFGIPTWAKTPLTISARLRYRKLNNQYASWALKDAFVSLPIIDMAYDAIVVPLRKKPESEPISPENLEYVEFSQK